MTDIENLEISIKALTAYSVGQPIIKDMLKKLDNINNELKKVSRVELPVICSEAKPNCEPMYSLSDILKAVRGELTVAFINDLTPQELQDKIYTVQGYIVEGVKSLANKIEPSGI